MKYLKIFRTLAVVIVLTLLASAIPAIPAQAAIGTINISSSSGPPGTTVSLTGSGFTANSTSTYTVWWYSNTYTLATGNASTGSFITYFTVPTYARGIYDIKVTTTAGDTSNILYYTITPYITLSYSSGYAGDQVTVSGTGFAASQAVTIYFDGSSLGITTTATASGTFSGATFTVPQSYAGSHTVTGSDGVSISPAVSFTTLSKLSITPTSGIVGEQITVNGTSFAASQTVTIYFDGEQAGTAATNSLGNFTGATFTVPKSSQGSHTVQAQDASGNSNTATFTTKQSATITPTSGTAGDTIAASGTGFQANQTITITFDSVEVGKATSDAKGSFNTSFPVPVRGAGIYKVAVSDGTYAASADLAISAIMRISQTTGYVGDNVTVRGTSFQAGKPISIIFGNDLVKTTSADNYGRFSASFTVPVRVAATYTVKVSDGINVREADFTILTSASISPTTSAASPGYVGTTLTISGVGFIAGRTVTITYDGTQVATTIIDTNRSFSTTFNAPASRGGQHTIIATDGATTKQFTFVMESTSPPIPAPLKPEMGIKAEAETYFDWEDVTDPSGVTYTLQIATSKDFTAGSIVLEKTGLIESEYTIAKEARLESVSKESPYYWHVKAVDGASNESGWSGTGSFYLGFSWALSQQVIYILFGIGALLLALLGFWLGRRTAQY